MPGPLPNLTLKLPFCLFLSPLNTCPQAPVCFHSASHFPGSRFPIPVPQWLPLPHLLGLYPLASFFLLNNHLPFPLSASPHPVPMTVSLAHLQCQPVSRAHLSLTMTAPFQFPSPIFWFLTHCLLGLCLIPVRHFHSLHSCPQVYPCGILIFVPYAPSRPVPNPSPRPSLPQYSPQPVLSCPPPP